MNVYVEKMNISLAFNNEKLSSRGNFENTGFKINHNSVACYINKIVLHVILIK